jgi:superfamily I DNA and/or RNA helicase
MYRSVRNKIKSAIKTANHNFYGKAISSKRSKNVWSVIHKILNPNPKRIRSDPAELNNFFVSTTQRIFGVDSSPGSDIVTYLESLPPD